MSLVSVIVPVYNSENYIETCLTSILGQTYTNLEIVLVNDGSTDQTARILYDYKERDSRIKVITIPNAGVGNARNVGLSHATGDYILFVDNDDWLEPNHIEILYTALETHACDIAIANFVEYLEEQGAYSFIVGKDDYFEKLYDVPAWFQEQYNAKGQLSQCFTVPWGKLYKRSLFENVLYPTNETVEDDYTTWKVYLMADKLIYLNTPIYCHRKRTTSVTKQVNLGDVFPLKSIEERMTMLSLLGMDIEQERIAYKARLQLHKDVLLKAGKTADYQKVLQKLNCLDKYRHS